MSKRNYNEGALILLENVEVNYPYLDPQNPDPEYAKWSIVAVMDKDQAEEMRDEGFNVSDEGTLMIKKKVATRDGSLNKPPKIVGRDGKTELHFSEAGRGAIVNVEVWAKKFRGQKNVSAFLNVIQVLEAAPEYEGDGEGQKSLIKAVD